MRSLGWVEIPEEDLAPGKSSIAVNNCIQQLSNSKGQSSAENQGEVRAWDGAARQGPTPGLLLLKLSHAGGGQGPVLVVESTLRTGHPSDGPRCRAGGSDRAVPWEQCQGAWVSMGMVAGKGRGGTGLIPQLG